MLHNTHITDGMISKALLLAEGYMNELEEGYNAADLYNEDETILVEIEAFCDKEGRIRSDYWTAPYFDGTIRKYSKKAVAFFYNEDCDDWIEIDITDKVEKIFN